MPQRDRDVQRVILIEGSVNLIVFIAKVVVGFTTGSLAVLGDAIHSLTDVVNNFVAWIVTRLSSLPPDREHPYGHRKFETLAVFFLASLLVKRVRSRWIGTDKSVDLVISVDPGISTSDSHDIASAIELLLEERFQVSDISIHVEPFNPESKMA